MYITKLMRSLFFILTAVNGAEQGIVQYTKPAKDISLPAYVKLPKQLPVIFEEYIKYDYYDNFVQIGQTKLYKQLCVEQGWLDFFLNENIYDPFIKAKKFQNNLYPLIKNYKKTNDRNFLHAGLGEIAKVKEDNIKVHISILYENKKLGIKSINFSFGLNYPTEAKTNFEYISDGIYINFRLRNLNLKDKKISFDLINVIPIRSGDTSRYTGQYYNGQYQYKSGKFLPNRQIAILPLIMNSNQGHIKGVCLVKIEEMD
jgi:hypothetical protein